MNKKCTHAVIAAVCAFSLIFSMTSCNNNDNSKTTVVPTPSETTVSKENTVTNAPVPQFDDNGSKITYVFVTDEQKNTVTNQAGLPVTELAILGKDNQVITEANGNPVPPVLSSSNQQAVQTQADFTNPDAPAEYKGYSSFLWLAPLSDNNNFIPFSENSQIVEVKVKIKEDAPDGNYKLLLNPKSSFCDEKNDISFKMESPVITIGNAEAPAAFDPSSTNDPVLYSTNAAAQPGDEITLSFMVANNPGIVAGASSFNYDNSVMTVETITVSDALSKGDFQTNIQ